VVAAAAVVLHQVKGFVQVGFGNSQFKTIYGLSSEERRNIAYFLEVLRGGMQQVWYSFSLSAKVLC